MIHANDFVLLLCSDLRVARVTSRGYFAGFAAPAQSRRKNEFRGLSPSTNFTKFQPSQEQLKTLGDCFTPDKVKSTA